MSRTVWLAGLALVLLAAPAAAEVLVDPPCGSVIQGKAILTQDVICAHLDAYELRGGDAFLDMRGHTLDNSGVEGACIVLSGRGARLRNGRVTNCHSGVSLSDQGGHTVDRMNASNNQESGFRIKSDDNTLRFVTANENANHGIVILGSNGNRVLGAMTTGNGVIGIAVLNSGGVSEGNRILRSTASNNLSNGILDEGIDTVVFGNRAEASTVAGFRYEGAGGTFKLNSATENTSHGFVIRGSDGRFSNNSARANGGDGFRVVTDASGNSLQRNRSFGNGGFDIRDLDEDCVDNTFVRNRFDTSNAACVE